MSEKNIETVNLIFIAPRSNSPEILGGAFSIGFGLAKTQDLRYGFYADTEFEDSVLKNLSADVQVALDYEKKAKIDDVEIKKFENLEDLSSFEGVILYVREDGSALEELKRIKAAKWVVVVPNTDAELKNIDEAFPFAGHARLSESSTTPKLSDSQIVRINWFEKRYEIISAGQFGSNSTEINLGERKDQVCRYCEKSMPDVSFSNISHAFPEQIGNKTLFDSIECDVCNKHFGEMLELHFGRWSLSSRSLGRIQGKKDKSPSYRSNDHKLRVDFSDGQLKFQVPKGDRRLQFDLAAKRMSLELERKPHIPMAVFKSFVKMALAVTPDPESSECAHLKKWILESSHTYESFPYSPLILFTQFISGPLPNENGTYVLLKRRLGITGCPYLQFVLTYSNYVYQIALPMPEQDVPDGRATFETSHFPHPWDTPEHNMKYGAADLFQTDLSSAEIKKGEVFPMRIAFGSAVEVDTNKKS